MDTNNKFSKFVAKLERKMLDGNKESMVLIGVQTSQIWGGSNAAGCTNSVSSCSGSINYKDCENSGNNCSSSINKKRCTNTLTQA